MDSELYRRVSPSIGGDFPVIAAADPLGGAAIRGIAAMRESLVTGLLLD